MNDGLLTYDVDVSEGVATFRTQLEQLLTSSSSEYFAFQRQAIQTCCATLQQATVDYLKEVGVASGAERKAERLQHRHWENLARGEAERYALLLGEFEAVKADHKRLFIRYMDVKSDNERLQRQVGARRACERRGPVQAVQELRHEPGGDQRALRGGDGRSVQAGDGGTGEGGRGEWG